MKVAVMEDIMKIGFVDRPVPEPKEDEVLVKLDYVGVCGSDLHYFEHGNIGDYVVKPPFVLGHEAGGVVVKTGKKVTKLKIGDNVALEPGKTCGKCEFCKSGKYNLCSNVAFFATPPIDGVFQEYVAYDADMCFKLPDNVDTLEGALIEPLSVGFHAAKQGDAHFGQTAVVTGAGCIGLVTLLALKTLGVEKVYVIDVINKRLEKAKEMGAAQVINAGEENVVERIKEITDGRGCDLAIDTSGNEICVRQDIEMLVKGGTFVFVGYSATDNMNLPTSMICDKEITLKSVFRYRNIYPLAIESVASGKVKIKNIVTDEFDLDDIQNGLNRCIANKTDIVKAVIRI